MDHRRLHAGFRGPVASAYAGSPQALIGMRVVMGIGAAGVFPATSRSDLQFDRGYSPLGAGALLIPMAVSIGLFAPISSGMTSRYGAKLVCAAGLALITISFGSFILVDHRTSVWVLEGLLFVLGAGNGMAMALPSPSAA